VRFRVWFRYQRRKAGLPPISMEEAQRRVTASIQLASVEEEEVHYYYTHTSNILLHLKIVLIYVGKAHGL
jgi:hypothetical protein